MGSFPQLVAERFLSEYRSTSPIRVLEQIVHLARDIVLQIKPLLSLIFGDTNFLLCHFTPTCFLISLFSLAEERDDPDTHYSETYFLRAVYPINHDGNSYGVVRCYYYH